MRRFICHSVVIVYDSLQCLGLHGFAYGVFYVAVWAAKYGRDAPAHGAAFIWIFVQSYAILKRIGICGAVYRPDCYVFWIFDEP